MLIAMRVALAVLAAALGTAAGAAPLAPGATPPPLLLVDQHDVAGSIGPDTQVVLFTRDMDGGDVAKAALAEHAALLASAHAVYVADISGMPSLVARLFAVPAMRKRPYRILLDRDGAPTADIPSHAGAVTLIRLRGGVVESIVYLDTAAAVQNALAAPAPPES